VIYRRAVRQGAIWKFFSVGGEQAVSNIAIQACLSNRHGSPKFDPVQDVDSFTQKRYGYLECFISMTIDGVVLGTADRGARFGGNLVGLPIASLWEI